MLTKKNFNFFMKIIFIFIFSFIVLSEAQAATNCHTLNNGSTIDSRYGAPYDVFSSAKETIIKAQCETNGADIEIGNGTEEQYIYNKGYILEGESWKSVTLNPTGTTDGDWLIGGATVNIPLSTSELAQSNYFLVYICTKVNFEWKCGCQDSTCATSHWQLQNFESAVKTPVDPIDPIYPSESCGDCGAGLFNLCDEEECLGLGDCEFTDNFIKTCSVVTKKTDDKLDNRVLGIAVSEKEVEISFSDILNACYYIQMEDGTKITDSENSLVGGLVEGCPSEGKYLPGYTKGLQILDREGLINGNRLIPGEECRFCFINNGDNTGDRCSRYFKIETSNSSGCNYEQSATVIIDNSNSSVFLGPKNKYTIHGTSASNKVTLDVGSHATLSNFVGSNIIELKSPLSVFDISSSGAYVFFEGSDCTYLQIPATATAQKINFSDGVSMDLIIENGNIKLGDEMITFNDPIEDNKRESCGAFSSYINGIFCGVNYNTGVAQEFGTIMDVTLLGDDGVCPTQAICVQGESDSENGWNWIFADDPEDTTITWDPAKDTVCFGEIFTQTSNTGLVRGGQQGTKSCDSCTPHATRKCYDDNEFYWYDSCGNREERVACLSGEYCEDSTGLCKNQEDTTITWDPAKDTVCFGEIFTQTSNTGLVRGGQQGTKSCDSGKNCVDGECVATISEPTTYKSPKELVCNRVTAEGMLGVFNWVFNFFGFELDNPYDWYIEKGRCPDSEGLEYFADKTKDDFTTVYNSICDPYGNNEECLNDLLCNDGDRYITNTENCEKR